MTYNEKYLLWQSSPYFDDETKKQLADIKDNPAEMKERFGNELEFGTGGLRGIVGAGTNRINKYVVRKASQGLTDHIISRHKESQGMVIGYDSRSQSKPFAAEAAKVFTGNGIKVYLFDNPRPTPMLSFAIRQLRAAAGVMITASHNPKEYNGYKVYGDDGAQLSNTGAVSAAIAKIEDIASVRLLDIDTAVNTGLLHTIGKQMDDDYLSSVKALIVDEETVNNYAAAIRIVYTPLHGIGGEIVSRALIETGFKGFQTVESQFQPDGDFPTLNTTLNPEDKDVYEHAIKLAKKQDADLIIATDPDCDRTGVMVRKARHQYVLLSGNQAGGLMLNYLLHKKRKVIPENSFIAKTIVTTQMADSIAEHYGIGVEEVLTGFKYIGELIRKLHDTGEKTFIFGLEDSCGYLIGTDVRDKDGVIGCLLIAETAAWYKSKGISLYEGLRQLQKKYGWFAGKLVSCHMNADQIRPLRKSLFSDMEASAFQDLGVTAVRNYAAQLRHDLKSGELTKLSLPKSDAVYYELADGWFCIRPSGTEAKLKIYIEACGKSDKAAKRKLETIKKSIMRTYIIERNSN